MLKMDVKVGQAVQIGEVAAVRVEQKSGQRVKLAIASNVHPIVLIPSGVIPRRFLLGITEEQARINELIGSQPQALRA